MEQAGISTGGHHYEALGKENAADLLGILEQTGTIARGRQQT